MAASPVAEKAVRPSGARTLQAVNAPGMVAWERQRGHSGRRLADPVWVAAGEGPAAVVTHSSTAPGICR